MKLLGIDVGREHNALLVFDLNSSKITLNITLSLPLAKSRRIRKYNPQYYRLDQIQSRFSAFMKEHKDELILAAVEDYIYPKRSFRPKEGDAMRFMYESIIAGNYETAHEYARSIKDVDAIALVEPMDWDALSLAEVHGIFMATLGKWGVPTIKISPTQVKYFATGRGRADKRAVIKSIYKSYDKELDDEHQFDALACVHIARYFVQYCHKPNSLRPGYARNVCNTIMFDKRFKGVAEQVRLNLKKLSEITT